MDTGVGVPRHPLFFLGRFRGGAKKGKAAGDTADTVTVSEGRSWERLSAACI